MHETEQIALREDFAPWSFAELASPAAKADQAAYQDELRARGHAVGADCVVSRLAAVHPDSLRLGDRSTVAAHAHLTGDLTIGADCTVNVGTVVRGTVTLGDAVRIGSRTSLLGFDHGTADLTVPIFRQPMSSLGITIGDDVWIGSHVVVLDGVSIGSHAVVGAGSVVTRDVPDWAVVVGNPARVVRDRRFPRGGAAGPADALRRFADQARTDAADLLARHWDGDHWADRPGGEPTVRAHCDAVEIADLLLGAPPGPLSREEHVARLRGWQADDGLVHELGRAAGGVPDLPLPGLGDDTDVYHVLCVGYALDVLGSTWRSPIAPLADLEPAAVVAALDALDFPHDAWSAGHRADALGTALTWELRAGRPVPEGVVEALLGWLLTHRDPGTGLWGRAGVDGLRLPVNGFYRTVRGTFAQLGVDLPSTEPTIDAVLRHAADPLTFGPGRETACDALDVLHPLWWLTRHDRRHRWPEVQGLARSHAERIVERWQPGRGFAFDTRTGSAPTLQGTEMWVATLWYAADLLDASDALGYRPRGVHRPEAAVALGG